jgi:aminoglycoside N3'-acetyltransferase
VDPAVVDDLRRLGVRPGQILLVHSSYRALRPVAGGPSGLIESLLEAIGPTGTLVMPSWTGDDDAPFDPRATPAAADLGIVAETFWRRLGVTRSAHAQAFAAIGPRAAQILADPLPLPPAIPASPVGRVHELDGFVALLGVGHDANTTIHLAEIMAGVPYSITKQMTLHEGGRATPITYRENDHCCERFALVDPPLRARGLQREGQVGRAQARLIRSRDVVEVACSLIARDPLIFLHERDCEECTLARASVR